MKIIVQENTQKEVKYFQHQNLFIFNYVELVQISIMDLQSIIREDKHFLGQILLIDQLEIKIMEKPEVQGIIKKMEKHILLLNQLIDL